MTTDVTTPGGGETTPPPPTPAPEPKKSFIERVTGALFAPVDTFTDIARKPDILAPLLLILVIGYISTAVVMPRIDMESVMAQQTEQVRKQNPNVSQEDLDRMERFSSAIAKVMGWVGPLLMIIWYLIVAGILLLAFRLMGGEGGFKQAFSTTLYAWIPLLVFGIISTIIIVARGSFDPTTAATLVKSNPAFLVDMKEQPVLFSLLSSFDIFTIWTVVLLIVGFSILSGLSRAKSAAIVITLWFVQIMIKVGFAALGAARMDA
jgi:hypothetical protein